MYKYLLILLLLSGCATKKRCERMYPPVHTVEIRDSIVYKDSIIIVPATHTVDTVKVRIDCTDGVGKIVPFISHSKQGRTAATITGSGNTLLVNNTCNELNLKVKQLESYKYHKEHEVHTPKIVKYIPKLYRWCFYIVLLEVLLIIGYILIRVYKTFR